MKSESNLMMLNSNGATELNLQEEQVQVLDLLKEEAEVEEEVVEKLVEVEGRLVEVKEVQQDVVTEEAVVAGVEDEEVEAELELR